MSRALVISGGGSKGAFAVGVVKKLLSNFPQLRFDVFVGTSTGSLIVPLLALGENALLEQLYTTVKTENIIKKFNIGDRLGEHSIFDATPLWNLLSQFYTDNAYTKLMNGGKKVYLNTTCLQSGNLVVYTNEAMPRPQERYEQITFTGPDHFRRAVLASACQPVFMPPVKVNQNVAGAANPDFQYVDGGVKEYAGVEIAINQGATEIFTILLSPEDKTPEAGEYKTIFPILERTIDIFTADVGKNDLIIPEQFNEGLNYIAKVKANMKNAGLSDAQIQNFFAVNDPTNPFSNKAPLHLFTIRPTSSLGGGPGGLNFDPDEMKDMVKTGELIAGDFIAALDPADVTWA
jgi:predicted acylesterase/phospholipase RssA